MNRLQKLITRILPTKSRFISNANQHPSVQAHMLDVDKLHTAFRAAEAGDTTELFGLYRDMLGAHSHAQSEFGKRKLAVLGNDMVITPKDSEDESQVQLADAVKEHLTSIPDFIFTLGHVLDSTLYPVSVTERLYRPSSHAGWRYEFADLKKVEHHNLIWPDGNFSFKLVDNDGNYTGEEEPIDTTSYIIHRGHLLTSLPDWHGGPMRAIMFWWFFSVASRDWWSRFLERFGSPFLVGRYDSNDDSARFELQHAFQAAQRIFGIVVSDGADIKMEQANSQGGGDAFEKFHTVANREISKIIIGQTLSAEGQNLGLGGGQGDAQSEVRDDIRKFDSRMLAHTIKTQILAPLWKVNAWTSPMPDVSFGGESAEDQAVTGKILRSLGSAGLRVTDDGIDTLTKKIGFSIERDKGTAPLSFSALSSKKEFTPRDPFIPSVARRAARKRQARSATESMLNAASPRLAKIMTSQFEEFVEAIEKSNSPDEAVESIATLTADFDSSEAVTLITNTLTAASVNALVASDR